MTARDFCYWLQGILEVGKIKSLDEEQVGMIKNHLNLVFVHDIDTPDPTGELGNAHDGACMVPGKVGENWHIAKQTCSACKTNWYECKHGKNDSRPRC